MPTFTKNVEEEQFIKETNCQTFNKTRICFDTYKRESLMYKVWLTFEMLPKSVKKKCKIYSLDLVSLVGTHLAILDWQVRMILPAANNLSLKPVRKREGERERGKTKEKARERRGGGRERSMF
jgi:hypothetical protein